MKRQRVAIALLKFSLDLRDEDLRERGRAIAQERADIQLEYRWRAAIRGNMRRRHACNPLYLSELQ